MLQASFKEKYMKNCTECGYEFTLKDRLKSLFRHPFEFRLKCQNCETMYKAKRTAHRFFYYFIVFTLSACFQEILRAIDIGHRWYIIILTLQIILSLVVLLSYDLVEHKHQKYEKLYKK